MLDLQRKVLKIECFLCVFPCLKLAGLAEYFMSYRSRYLQNVYRVHGGISDWPRTIGVSHLSSFLRFDVHFMRRKGQTILFWDVPFIFLDSFRIHLVKQRGEKENHFKPHLFYFQANPGSGSPSALDSGDREWGAHLLCPQQHRGLTSHCIPVWRLHTWLFQALLSVSVLFDYYLF